jgi:hypothetical protein
MTPREKLVVAPANITLEEAKQILHKHRLEKLPLIDEQGNLKGLITAKDILYKLHRPYASLDSKGSLLVGRKRPTPKKSFSFLFFFFFFAIRLIGGWSSLPLPPLCNRLEQLWV